VERIGRLFEGGHSTFLDSSNKSVGRSSFQVRDCCLARRKEELHAAPRPRLGCISRGGKCRGMSGPEPGAASAALLLDGSKMKMRIYSVHRVAHGATAGQIVLYCQAVVPVHSKWAATERTQLLQLAEIGSCGESEARQPLYFPSYARPVEGGGTSGLVCSTTASVVDSGTR
jgi:hypothetical protein